VAVLLTYFSTICIKRVGKVKCTLVHALRLLQAVRPIGEVEV